jgi:hypothetical protein
MHSPDFVLSKDFSPLDPEGDDVMQRPLCSNKGSPIQRVGFDLSNETLAFLTRPGLLSVGAIIWSPSPSVAWNTWLWTNSVEPFSESPVATLSPELGGISGDSLCSLLAHLPIEIHISRQKLSIIASRKEELKNGVISSTYC